MYAWLWRHGCPGPVAAQARRHARRSCCGRRAAVLRRLPVGSSRGCRSDDGRLDDARPHPVPRQTMRADGRASRAILVVDNYDSFVYNLVQYLAQLGADVDGAAQRRRDADELDDWLSTACCCPPARARPSGRASCMALVPLR